MKKKTLDVGVEYLKLVGIKAAKSRDAIKKELEEEFGQKETAIFLKEFNDLCDKGDFKSYDYKNSEFKRSMIFTGGFDGDIIRKCCNWIKENIDSFGKNILEIGCDCGLMTCFLGLALPDSTILSIDREEKGIQIAEKLAEKLGINNVTFKKANLSELEESEFDTVFSMRTATENGFCSEDPSNSFIEQADSFKTALSEYGRLVASKVKDGGTLISIENTGIDTFLAGWIEALYNAGMNGDISKHKEIICKEVGETVDFQAIVFNKVNPEEKGIDFFLKIMNAVGGYKFGQFTGWNAKLIYETGREELLDGFKVLGPEGVADNIFSLWSVKNDPNRILFYQSFEGGSIAQLHPIARKSKLDKALNECMENAKKYSTLKIEML